MSTVYDAFLEYYHQIKTNHNDPAPVEAGIASYLESIGILPHTHFPDAEKIAHRELLRFKLMPEKTFVAFFENYATRNNIVQFVRETELLAINRSVKDKMISQEVYFNKLNTFYAISKELAADKRYTSWITSTLDEVTENLKYAAGLINTIPHKIAEKVLFAEENN